MLFSHKVFFLNNDWKTVFLLSPFQVSNKRVLTWGNHDPISQSDVKTKIGQAC